MKLTRVGFADLGLMTIILRSTRGIQEGCTYFITMQWRARPVCSGAWQRIEERRNTELAHVLVRALSFCFGLVGQTYFGSA